MSYQTIMVHLQLGHSNTAVLQAATTLAKRFNAAVIGIVVGLQTQMIYGKSFAMVDYFDRESDHLEEKIAAEEVLFRAAFKNHTKPISWRQAITMEPVENFIVAQACAADLIITSVHPSDLYDTYSNAHAGEILMQAGRPVLAVPASAEHFKLDNMLIGWKDTREARRAIVDALPLLALAKQVALLEIATKNNKQDAAKRLENIAAWLVSHGIAAKSIVSISKDSDATQFMAEAKKQQADIVIAGAYGHSRFREWVLGGVTNELLQSTQFCAFLSH
jgi:nucleotide-binding universal stress UspA family protein